MKKILIACALSSCGVVQGKSQPDPLAEIGQLIDLIERSKCDFNRNGTVYQSKEAADHLRRKLDSATSSIFSPSADKWTAEMFIAEIATQSSMSGRPYIILCPKSPAMNSADWLKARLRKLRERKAQQNPKK